jgi:hypothetical protein
MTMTDIPRGESRPAYPVRVMAVGEEEFIWRLTASNGRSMARSAATFPTTAAALSAFDAAVALASSRALSGSVGHRPGGWGWTVLDDNGRPLAHAPRTFERHGSCARSLQRFRAALAALGPTPDG